MSEAEFRQLNLGDVHDDDGQVLDDLVRQQAEPPAPIPDSLTRATTERPKRLSRLQTGRVTIPTGWQPVSIFGQDSNRSTCTISVETTNATDFVTFADTSNNAPYGASVFAANPVTVYDHTGPVWVNNSTANSITVSFWAVTS